MKAIISVKALCEFNSIESGIDYPQRQKFGVKGTSISISVPEGSFCP